MEAGVLPDHEHLRAASRSEQSDDEISPYRYGPAVSPHLAAELAEAPIDPDVLKARLANARDAGDYLVCEGVGGFLVPLRRDYLIRDFAVYVALPVVIVSSPGLGTINHTLLTLDAVRSAGLQVADVVLTPWPDKPDAMLESNAHTIADLGEVGVVTWGTVDPAAPETWGEYRPSAASERR
jgi:dethiobiotin synthetase